MQTPFQNTPWRQHKAREEPGSSQAMPALLDMPAMPAMPRAGSEAVTSPSGSHDDTSQDRDVCPRTTSLTHTCQGHTQQNVDSCCLSLFTGICCSGTQKTC